MEKLEPLHHINEWDKIFYVYISIRIYGLRLVFQNETW